MIDLGVKLSQDKLRQVLPEYTEVRKQFISIINFVMSPEFMDKLVNSYAGK